MNGFIGNSNTMNESVVMGATFVSPANVVLPEKVDWRKSGATGWGKITSLNFKVNNTKTIRDTKILFLDSETTAWEVLNHIAPVTLVLLINTA